MDERVGQPSPSVVNRGLLYIGESSDCGTGVLNLIFVLHMCCSSSGHPQCDPSPHVLLSLGPSQPAKMTS